MPPPNFKIFVEDEEDDEYYGDMDTDPVTPEEVVRITRKIRKEMKRRMTQREILRQSMNDKTSYSLKNTTIKQQAANETNFIGDAHYYVLDQKKARPAIHGTYLIVYSRPLAYETDNDGNVIFELHEPNIKNTLCIFTKHVTPPKNKPNKEGHKKVNDLLDTGLYGVGHLRYGPRNLTLNIHPNFRDDGIIAIAIPQSKDTVESQSGPYTGDLDRGLAAGAINDTSACMEFGAKIMRLMDDIDGETYHCGFYFVTLEAPLLNEDGEEEMHYIVAVKIPDEQDVTSGFILNQEVFVSKKAYMEFFEYGNKHQPKPKSKPKKKKYKEPKMSMADLRSPSPRSPLSERGRGDPVKSIPLRSPSPVRRYRSPSPPRSLLTGYGGLSIAGAGTDFLKPLPPGKFTRILKNLERVAVESKDKAKGKGLAGDTSVVIDLTNDPDSSDNDTVKND